MSIPPRNRPDTQETQSLDVDGLRIAYRRTGSGPPLVLLHGFICDSRAWLPQIEALSSDFDVIAWDTPGCGESPDTGEEYAMSEYADCLAGFLDQVGVTDAHLCGLSWGGTLALEFYRRFPARVRSLILADSYAGWSGSLGAEASAARLERCLRESDLPPGEWIPQWVPDAFSSNAPAEMIDGFAEIMWDFHPVGFRAMSRAVAPDFSDILPAIAASSLLIWGEEDRRSPVQAGEKMRDTIPGSTLITIPRAGHLSNVEQPERFNEAVHAFINRIERGAD